MTSIAYNTFFRKDTVEHNEECYVLWGAKWWKFWQGQCLSYSKGEPGGVEFDYNWVEDNLNGVIGWVHTHPSMIASPSSKDDNTMRAWVFSLGRPLVCCIKGSDGLRAHWYLDDESPSVEGPVKRFGSVLTGVIPSGKNIRT